MSLPLRYYESQSRRSASSCYWIGEPPPRPCRRRPAGAESSGARVGAPRTSLSRTTAARGRARLRRRAAGSARVGDAVCCSRPSAAGALRLAAGCGRAWHRMMDCGWMRPLQQLPALGSCCVRQRARRLPLVTVASQAQRPREESPRLRLLQLRAAAAWEHSVRAGSRRGAPPSLFAAARALHRGGRATVAGVRRPAAAEAPLVPVDEGAHHHRPEPRRAAPPPGRSVRRSHERRPRPRCTARARRRGGRRGDCQCGIVTCVR